MPFYFPDALFSSAPCTLWLCQINIFKLKLNNIMTFINDIMAPNRYQTIEWTNQGLVWCAVRHHQLSVDLVIITYLLWILWIGFSPTGWGHCRHPPLLPPESSFLGVPPTVFSAGHSWTSLTGYLSHTCGRQCSQGWVAGRVQYLLEIMIQMGFEYILITLCGITDVLR